MKICHEQGKKWEKRKMFERKTHSSLRHTELGMLAVYWMVERAAGTQVQTTNEISGWGTSIRQVYKQIVALGPVLHHIYTRDKKNSKTVKSKQKTSNAQQHQNWEAERLKRRHRKHKSRKSQTCKKTHPKGGKRGAKYSKEDQAHRRHLINGCSWKV